MNMYHGVVGAGASDLPFAESVDVATHVKVMDAAIALGIEPSRMYFLIKAGRVKAVRTPAGMMIPITAVEAERARREARTRGVKKAAE